MFILAALKGGEDKRRPKGGFPPFWISPLETRGDGRLCVSLDGLPVLRFDGRASRFVFGWTMLL